VKHVVRRPVRSIRSSVMKTETFVGSVRARLPVSPAETTSVASAPASELTKERNVICASTRKTTVDSTMEEKRQSDMKKCLACLIHPVVYCSNCNWRGACAECALPVMNKTSRKFPGYNQICDLHDKESPSCKEHPGGAICWTEPDGPAQFREYEVAQEKIDNETS